MRTPSLWGGRRLPTHNELMSQFEEFINEIDPHLTPTLRGAGMDFSPAVDFEDKGANYLVTVDLPGLKKEDIKIEMADGVLSISGERVKEEKSEGGHYYERAHGKFMRTFTLPGQVNADKINASFDNGVLRVTLPKTEGSHSRAIKIQ